MGLVWVTEESCVLDLGGSVGVGVRGLLSLTMSFEILCVCGVGAWGGVIKAEKCRLCYFCIYICFPKKNHLIFCSLSFFLL